MRKKVKRDKVACSLDEHLCVRESDLKSAVRLALLGRFTKKNPKFYQLQRLGKWTGNTEPKIRSWHRDGEWLLFPRGAIDDVRAIMRKGGQLLAEPHDHRTTGEPPKMDGLKKPLYPFQEATVAAMLKHDCGVLRGPPASGKTVILLGLIARLRQPTLIVVHNGPLLEQWVQRCIEFLGYVPGVVGRSEENVRPITIGMQQTLWRRTDANWLDRFGCVLVDEAHHLAARTYLVVGEMFPAKHRYGCTADERRKDRMEWLIYDTIGPLRHTIHKEDLIEVGRLVPVHLVMYPTDYEDPVVDIAREEDVPPDWTGMVTRMCEDAERTDRILEGVLTVAQRRGTRQLVLSDRVDWCIECAERMTEEGVKTSLALGGSNQPKKVTEDALDDLRLGRVKLVFATTHLAAEALDIPALTHVWATSPAHNNPGRLEQIAGRAARKRGRKKQGVFMYVWDKNVFPGSDASLGKVKSFVRRMAKKFEKHTIAERFDQIP